MCLTLHYSNKSKVETLTSVNNQFPTYELVVAINMPTEYIIMQHVVYKVLEIDILISMHNIMLQNVP